MHEGQRGLTQVQVMQGGPQVDHVPFLLALRVEALKDVLIEVDAKSSATPVGAMDRTGAALLRTGAAQFIAS